MAAPEGLLSTYSGTPQPEPSVIVDEEPEQAAIEGGEVAFDSSETSKETDEDLGSIPSASTQPMSKRISERLPDAKG